ncbi:SH2 domain-containing protein A isoform X2 [Cryptomeria japonica]|nr:SH2 domain-containing protein A isoform X2 [Cryptomeria japonica]
MWIYVVKSSKGNIIINQVQQNGEAALPFLTLDSDRKLSLFPAMLCKLDVDGALAAAIENCSVTAEVPCPLDKWVHVGCEVSTNVIRLHIDGVVVGEKRVAYASQNGVIEENLKPLNLVGTDSNCNGVQGYAHYVRILIQPAVTNHYVKNPPLELALDGSSGASDDYNLEESGDGIWSVVGGKASCRRNFALDVVLLDALGRSIHKDMELVALLVYADNGTLVEKPKDNAEAPLLTTFDGVEFPSTERPIRLIHGRASFKLKISQLSSKCDNRLFRVCFDSSHSMNYPFLRVFSRPIRCVSRNRNSRTLSVSWKKPNASAYQLDTACSPRTDEPSESQLVNGDNLVHGSITQTTKITPVLKRVKVGHEKLSIRLANSNSDLDQYSNVEGNACNLSGNDTSIASPTELPKVLHGHSPLGAAYGHCRNDSSDHAMPLPINSNQTDSLFSTNLKIKSENFQGTNSICDNIYAQKSAAMRFGASEGAFSDYVVFKYCLENIFNRSLFLKGTVMSRSDQDVADFAACVSQYTGCHHNGYQILIAKQLIQEGIDLWKMLTKDMYPLPWDTVIHHMEKRFIMITNSKRRKFTSQDKEFLRRIAGCSETIVREEFDQLWQWLFPVALSLSNPQIKRAWESMEPRWIEGMISREEAEALLSTSEGSAKPGSFIIRFPSSRSWPHPDAGALIATYVGTDNGLHHRILSLEERLSSGDRMDALKPVEELLLAQPELSEVCRVPRSPQEA